MALTPVYNFAAAVVKHDTNDFPNGPCQALYVGGAGDIVVVFPDGRTCTFTAVAAGTLIPLTAKRVNSTGTTATNMVALYQV